MKIRIKFRKYSVMKFVGHLDLQRYFQKALRRAEIDVTFSGGYSPHPVMSFASPLGVGLTSDGEYLDIEVNSTKSTQESIDALNRVGVEGIEIVDYKELPDNAANAMSCVAAADYSVTLMEKTAINSSKEINGWNKILQDFWLGQVEILITKETKKSERTIDLKPLIYEMKMIEETDSGKDGAEFQPQIFMKLSSGSTDNIKPELVMEALFKFLQIEPVDFQIHRLEVYTRNQEMELVALGE